MRSSTFLFLAHVHSHVSFSESLFICNRLERENLRQRWDQVLFIFYIFAGRPRLLYSLNPTTLTSNGLWPWGRTSSPVRAYWFSIFEVSGASSTQFWRRRWHRQHGGISHLDHNLNLSWLSHELRVQIPENYPAKMWSRSYEIVAISLIARRARRNDQRDEHERIRHRHVLPACYADHPHKWQV